MDPNAQFQPSTNPAPVGVSSVDKLAKTRTKFIIVTICLVILIIISGFLGYRAYQGTASLSKKYNEGYSTGQKEQSKADDAKIKELNENPYRSFTAPKEVGSFTLLFPRNWSLATTVKTGDSFSGLFSPDFVDLNATLYSLRVIVRDGSYDDQLARLRSSAKASKKKLNEATVEVSGVKGAKFIGLLDQKITNGTEIILPLRDKTLIIQTDDNDKYGRYYDDIVAKMKINP